MDSRLKILHCERYYRCKHETEGINVFEMPKHFKEIIGKRKSNTSFEKLNKMKLEWLETKRLKKYSTLLISYLQ